MSKAITPNHREILAAQSSISGTPQYLHSTNNALDVNVTGSIITGDINLTEVGGLSITLGQKTMANSLPITIASDQSSLNVGIVGGSVGLLAGSATIGSINNISGTISLPTGASTSANQTNGSQKSQIVDGSGNIIGSTSNALNVNISSGNITGYATSTNQTNGLQLTQIVDAGGDAVTVTGGKLDVNATISGSGGGTSSIDKSAFTVGSDTGTPAMGIYQNSLDTITSGTVAVVGLTPKRGMFVNLQTASGTETGVAAVPLQVSLANTGANSTAVKVDGTGGTFPISGTVAATQSGTWNIGTVTTITSITNQVDTNLKQVGGTNTVTAGVNGTQAIGGNQATNNNVSTNVNPVLIAGSDYAGTPKIQNWKVDSSGIGQVNIANSSLAVTQSTSPWIVAGGGTAGSAASGVVTVQGIASMTPVQVSQATASNLNATVSQGTAANLNATVIGTGTFAVQAAQSGTWTVQPGNTANTTPWLNAPSAATGAVGTAIYNNTALSSTKQAVNASAGNMYGYHIYNPNGVVIYVQLFNLASASVTVGTTAPTAVIAVPPLGWADASPATPIAFGTALTIAATTTATGSGSPTTALLANFWYK